MIKGLEAFEYIKNNIHYFEPVCQEDEDKINQVNKTIEKELKALEIIKKKRVNVHVFILYLTADTKYVPSYIEYKRDRLGDNLDYYELTQEEYDLLKEVLL